MGLELFERYPDLVTEADEILGHSLVEMCRADPDGALRRTENAQPAIYVVDALAFLERSEHDGPPAFLAGHSLGEYAALFAAGCFDFGTGLRLVKKRGELMATAPAGAMVAVVGADPEVVAEICADADVEVANYNSPDQVVISGAKDLLDDAVSVLEKREVGRVMPLPVSGAFHSRLMRDAADQFATSLAEVEFTDPRIPVIANRTGAPYEPGQVARTLAEQIASPVRWLQSMTHLIEHEVQDVVELGPGTVLTSLWRSAQRAAAEAPPRAQREPARRERVQREPAPRQPARPNGSAARAERDGTALTAESLGAADFRRDYGVRFAYAAGAMYHGIASTELVVAMGRAGLIGFFGAGGLRVERVEEAITTLQRELGDDGRYGMNLLCTLDNPRLEEKIVDTYLSRGVRFVEAAAYPQLTAPLVRWRFSGAYRDRSGRPTLRNQVLAKVSRPEVAEAFMSPPPDRLVRGLVADGQLTAEEGEIAACLPVSNDICVESDSAGHTDAGVALALLPAMLQLRSTVAGRHDYPNPIRVGAAGGLGTPEALAAVFVLGADFVVTGSINQCTPQAGTSDSAKDILAALDVQDTTYAPAGDLFELGAQVQVARKGTLFPVRANKLFQLYRQHQRWEDVDEATRRTVEQDYFGCAFDEVWSETRAYLAERHPDELARAERDEHRQMALTFRSYFRKSSDVVIAGDEDARVDYQIHCGPAMGAFNRWVADTPLADWHERDVAVIGERLMTATADLLNERYAQMGGQVDALLNSER